MPYKPTEIRRVLTTVLGFTLDNAREDGHDWYKLEVEGVPRVIRTRISHSKGKEYHKGLEAAVARQLHVPTPFFRQIMRGEKTRDDYLREVRTNPMPPFD